MMGSKNSASAGVGVAVLARRAELGKGKRRLAATLGDEATLAVYRELIGACAKTVAASGLPATVYFEPAVGDEDVWPQESFEHALQPSNADLGGRIRAAAEDSLLRNPGGVLLIGTDCPTLTPALLTEAADALSSYDVVLGPSTDGGYYLLATRALEPRLFEGIAWSTEAVADQTRAVFAKAGLRAHELPALTDVDTAEDWRAYRAAHKLP